jgi:uncharacterized protein YjiS (DUF1127 family)
MTTISSIAPSSVSQTPLGRLLDLISVPAQALLTYWHRRAAVKALLAMDDRALRDIGISRSQITSAVGGAMNPDMGWMR